MEQFHAGVHDQFDVLLRIHYKTRCLGDGLRLVEVQKRLRKCRLEDYLTVWIMCCAPVKQHCTVHTPGKEQ